MAQKVKVTVVCDLLALTGSRTGRDIGVHKYGCRIAQF
jgi:tetrahydromethanopterin S-methyltransferase subunit G